MVSCWLLITFMSMKYAYASVYFTWWTENWVQLLLTAEANFAGDFSLVHTSITFILGRDSFASTVICCYNCSVCGQYGKLYYGCLLTTSPGNFCLNAPYWIPAGLRCLCNLQAWWPVCSSTPPSPPSLIRNREFGSSALQSNGENMNFRNILL